MKNEGNGNSREAALPAEGEEIELDLSRIKQNDTFRCREAEDEETIERYAEQFADYMKAEEQGEELDYPFPPISVWYDNGQYVLLGGYHRLEAARRAGSKTIMVRVFYGTEGDVFMVAMRDNGKHGLPLRSGDRRLIVMKALQRFPDMSMRAIASGLGCAPSSVSKIANELYDSGQLVRPETKQGLD